MCVVLIVEDEMLEREFLESVVREELHPDDLLFTCDSGIQAIELAKQHRPDVIIMDVMITETDGLTAIEEIRKFLPDTPISILSACSNFVYAQKAINLKVFEYLLKPVKPSVFREVFCKMLHVGADTHKLVREGMEPKSQADKKVRHYFIEESEQYIKDNFRERLTLEAVASRVFVNPKYFSHIFKKETGVAFTEYVNNLRIQYACKMLLTTHYPAYRISLECGFSDPSYFNRVFCSQMHMTPQTFRKFSAETKLHN